MHNVIGLVMLLATAALLVWSSIRACRAKNNPLKWGSVGLATLLAAAVSFASVLTIVGLFKLHTRSAPVPDLKVAGTREQIQRGQAIADASVALAIRKPAHSPATWTLASISRSLWGHSCPPT
jgi:uncharacterized membrane protein YcjF (UPF0283 family)